MRRESQKDKEREGDCNSESGQHAEQDHAKGRHDREAEFEHMRVSKTERAANIDETDARKDEHRAKRAVRHVGQRGGKKQEPRSRGQCAHDTHDLGAAPYRVIDRGAILRH